MEKPSGPGKRHHLRKLLRSLILVLLGLAVIAMGLLYALQNHLIFFPEKGLPAPAQVNLEGVEEVAYTASDDTRLVSWFAPPREGRPMILFFHGNAGSLAYRADRMREAQEDGLGMLLCGYRGYGKSEGSPDEAGLYLDSRAALAFVRGRPDVDAKKLVYFGESLGCAVALELAAIEPPAALVLEAPFASMREEAAYVFPWLPTSLLLRSSFDNRAQAGKISCPAFVAHGRQDEVVPFEQGKAVYEALVGKKQFFPLDCHHNDIPIAGGMRYLDAWRTFIREHVR